jgi:hypothetical protein
MPRLKKSYSEYKNWLSMKARCGYQYEYNRYKDVEMCSEWKDFWVFLKDMGLKPTPNHTIERKDRDKGYSPSNCIWATKADQQVNRATPKNNKSGYRGVSYRTARKHWRANICYEGNKVEIGNFKNPEDAAIAYNEVAKVLHGKNAQLNVV